MLISRNSHNELKSTAKDVYVHYFEQPSFRDEDEILKPKNEEYFLNFISQVNDFAANTVKFIADEADLSFIGLV